MNKKISTTAGIITIIILAVIIIGGVFAYQYYWPTSEKEQQNQEEQQQKIDSSGLDDCLMYSELGSDSNCYKEYCIESSLNLNKEFLIGKSIESHYGSGMLWKFIDNTKVSIYRADSSEGSFVTGTWKIVDEEIVIYDPSIKDPNKQISFNGLQLFDCGNGKEGGVLFNSYGSEYRFLIE